MGNELINESKNQIMNILSLKIKSGLSLMTFLMPVWVFAQLSITADVLGNGSTLTSNAQWTIKSTLAQPLIGLAAGNSKQQQIGFWYQPKVLLTHVEQVSPNGFANDALLGQNFPNPGNTFTTIPFSVPYESFAELILMNSSGKIISRFAEDRFPKGQYQVEVGISQLPSGTYLYQLYVDQQLAGSRKMVVGR